MERTPLSPEKTGIRKRVVGVINRLVQRTFLSYLLLVAVVGVATFLVMHYYTDLFKDDSGKKRTMHQALAAAGVAVLAGLVAFFTRLL